jgi:tRNA 2-selenouridine synthase
MSEVLSVSAFLEQARRKPVIDVRSPAEYTRAHLPGAINIPLFDNEERARVGTCYKQVGRDAAVLLGLEIVGPKLAGFVRQANTLGGDVLIHCWRGGMRSGSMAWLLQTAGLQVATLAGGYKAYRNYVIAGLSRPQPMFILGGATGSGKTRTLQALAELGEQVIDLEGLAHHRGSAFGMIGQAPQPSSEMFENLLYQQWQTLDPERVVWLEDESRMIGHCYIPDLLWEQMQRAPVVCLDVPLEARVAELVKGYGHYPHTDLAEALGRIKKRLGGQHFQAAIRALEEADYDQVARISLVYYDRAYQVSLSNHAPQQVQRLVVDSTDAQANSQMLLSWAASYLAVPTP